MKSPEESVFVLWCRLTGNEPTDFGDDARESFLLRPQIAELARSPYDLLLDAGIATARRGSLPLERWLAALRVISEQQARSA